MASLATPVPHVQPQGRGLVPAPFGRRAAAFILDQAILGSLQLPITFLVGLAAGLLGGPLGAPELVHAASQLFTVLFTLATLWLYSGWFYAHRGATPGKLLLGLRCVRVKDGSRLSWGRTLLREGPGKALSGLILTAGYWMALARDDQKALHDLLCDTHVVYQPEAREAPLLVPRD